MIKKIALFGGTTEGRILAEELSLRPFPFRVSVFVATEYGKDELSSQEGIRVVCGRLNEEEMENLFSQESYDLVIDATHSFAREVSENIRKACQRTGILLWRVLREEEEIPRGLPALYVARDLADAVEYLKGTKGNILAATGSKELAAFCQLPDWKERVYARVLSLPEVVSACSAMGFYGKHLIAMEGPFSRELNKAMLKSVEGKWLVTKESGKNGGFAEKAAAAADAGAGLVVIQRPREQGIFVSEALSRLKELAGISDEDVSAPETRQFWLIGAGPGNPKLLTGEAREALKNCDLLAGARRNVDQLAFLKKPSLPEYQPEKILEFLTLHRQYKKIAVALSGDPGFYSGARNLQEAFLKVPGTEVKVIPGISSMNYFFSRIGKSWEHAKLLSVHGREADFGKAVREQEQVFLLAGGQGSFEAVCEKLIAEDLGFVHLTVGENLSLPGERFFEGTAKSLKGTEAAPLSVIFIENPKAGFRAGKSRLTHGLDDEAFLRGKVPMTKMEVRAVSVAKLGLWPGAVVYDVGAGTGSVSVECASLDSGLRVYAVEKNTEAVALLYENRKKFALSNMEIVEGRAPEAFEELPPPTHAFIGGSGGSMGTIVRAILKKNPKTRFVVNAIMPETLSELLSVLKEEGIQDPDMVQMTAARSKKVGSGHLMMGQNPVWIVSFQK